MKFKLLLFTACLMGSLTAFAQKKELNKGKASYSKFNEVKSIGTASLGLKDLEAARVALEKASEHEKTKEDIETWTYLALTYADLSLIDSTNAEEHSKKAESALHEAKKLDTENVQAENLDVVAHILAQGVLTSGVKAFEKQDFKSAYDNFNKGSEYLPGDTIFTYYAGLSALNGKDYEHAIEKFKALLEHDDFSTLNQVYLELSRIYMMQEDTLTAIKYADEGAAKFPGSADLATYKIELNLQAGNDQKVISDIESQIAKSPDDKRLYYYLGIAYGGAGEDEKAEAAYRKAIEIDPEYSDVYINLGGLMLNNGIMVFREASNIPTNEQSKYNAEMQRGNELIDLALPFLTKATETAPESAISWQNLKTYYQLKENEEKIEEIDEKLNALP